MKEEKKARVQRTSARNWTRFIHSSGIFCDGWILTRKCRKFIEWLAEMISDKRRIEYNETVSWVADRLYVDKSSSHMLSCGSRSTHAKHVLSAFDMGWSETLARIPQW